MNNRKLLGVAVSSILGAFANTASAFTYDFTASSTPAAAVYANELPTSTTSLVIPTAIIKLPVPATDVSASSPFFIKLKLTGATKLKSGAIDPVVYCSVSGLGSKNLNLQLGAGTDTIVYQLVVTGAVAASKYRLTTTSLCSVSANGAAITAYMSTLSTVGLTATIQYKDGVDELKKTYSTQLISFADALSVEYQTNSKNAIIDVTKGSKKFTTAGSLGGTKTDVSEVTAYLGSLKYAPVGSIFDKDGTSFTLGDAVSTVDIVLSGPTLGAVTTTGKIVMVTGIAGSVTNPCPLANVRSSKQASGSSVSFSLNSSDVAKLELGQINFCLTTKAGVALEKGQITATLKVTPAAGARPAVGGTNNNLMLVKKNGSSKKALNVPFPENADDPFIRINNMTTGTGRIFITLYGEDGKVIGNGGVALAEALGSRAVVALTAETIAGLIGVSSWEKRAWLQIESELSDIAVQNLVRSNNTLTNMSDGVKGSN